LEEYGDLETYIALTNPRIETSWNAEQRRYLDDLNLFGIRQLLSLLLAGRRRLSDTDFTSLLRACSIITFRYTIISGLANNLLESTYRSVSKRIAGNQLQTLHDVLQELKPVYVADDQFSQAFASKSITTHGRGNRVVRNILFALERQVNNVHLNTESPEYSIEHILPESPQDRWPHVSADDHADLVFRLGNLSLLLTSQNRDIGNAAWSDEKPVMMASSFAITRRAGDAKEWDEAQIDGRQNWMAGLAKSVWRVSQFD
jgi:hypothetical protein